VPDIVLRVLSFLNEYANLLLVLVTTIYAWLTWRSLRALRESTLRDREARHLDNIKEKVIQPIVSWITLTALDRFTGNQSPELLRVSNGPDGSRAVSHTVDNPFVGRQRLAVSGDPDVVDPIGSWDSTERGRVSEFLYEHTKRDHFRSELREFARFLENVRKLTGAVVSFANESTEKIAALDVPIARNSDDEKGLPEWINPHLLAAVCIESLLLGRPHPRAEIRDFPAPAGFHLLVDARNTSIAKANHPNTLKLWSDLAFEKVRNRWEDLKFPESVRKLSTDGIAVRQNIGQLMFTQALTVDCELVSGKSHWWRKFRPRN
jgi:hypothetical protein